jgi:2-succinyl-6-hydroxy-2,4-cyclohexadiene-1-carboxylate synthase
MTNHNLPIWTYHSRGEPHLPPVVCLHGFMGAGADWLPLAEQWAGRFFCLLPDLPGHGGNQQFPLSSPLDFESVGQGLHLFLQHLHLDRVSLVGYSLGGRIALDAATKFPQKIKTLVLESCHAGIENDQARRDRAAADERQAESLLAHGMDSFVEQWYKLDLFKTLQRRPQLLAELKANRKKNDPRWMAKVIKELSPGRQPLLGEKLGSLPMPTLLLAGELDAKYVDLVGRLGSQIPQAVVKIIPDAGHNVHLEQPEKFAETVVNFLQEQQLR